MKHFFLFLGLLIVPPAFASFQCKTGGRPSHYNAVKTDLNKKIEVFANHQLIATQADALLSKLISAKSPVISSWLSKRDLAKKSEDEVVKAWRLYFAQNFMLTKYPQDDSKVNAEIEKLVDQALAGGLDLKFKKRMNKLLKTAQKKAVETVESFKIEKGSVIIERIKSIRLYWPKDLKSARNNSIPLDLISWGIAYDPVANEINMGLEALSYPNDETYLAVFAHEIGHSFDSCRWGAFFDGKWPFEKIGECLRSDQSVGAKKRDDSQLESFQKAGKISADLVTGLKLNPTCNKFVYPPPGIQADQLPESFADWFSAEVMARAKEIDASQMRLDLCEEKELVKGSSYPTNEKRLEKIYFLQPQLKNKVKGKDSLEGTYCSLI